QLADPKPWDLLQTDLNSYKNLKAPYNDWNEIKRRALAVSQKMMVELMVSGA
ncbi:MAG: hypothetical protein HYW02_00805, partial [Deltaproteobacteria bacterium]|nr:hypothetical protein [Deltaproteobacteria bacterium]